MFHPFLRLIRFDKPIGSLLLFYPTIISLFMAKHGIPADTLLLIFTIEIFLTRSAGCIINDILDVKFDKYVMRTKARVLVLNQLSIKSAWIYFITLLIIAGIIAVIYLKAVTILLTVPALILLSTYPLMKRIIFCPQLYLGIAFSFGILMGFIEITGTITITAWELFGANLFWVVGYDTIYALCDIKDDMKLKVHSLAIFSGKYVNIVIFFSYLLHILLMIDIGMSQHYSKYYFLGIVIASIFLIYQIIQLYKKDTQQHLQLFLLNNLVGMVEFIFIVYEML